MSAVKETLKVNDELSIDIDVIYRNGEKYARSRSQYELLRLLYYVYCDALSDHINNEQYVLSDNPPELSLWDIWNENKWKKYKNQYIEFRTLDEANIYIYGDQYGLDGNTIWHHFMPDINEDVMFPFSLCDDGRYHSDEFIHFDIFIFALYLEYPQCKNDLIRFLKYQPVCTKTSDELYIYNLKQTNKDLLKQLNEANDKVASVVKTEAKLKATEDELQSKTNELNKLMGDMVDVSIEYHDLHEIHSTAITKLKEVTDSVDAKDKEIETLKTDIEAKDKIIEQLTEVVTTASNERDEWKSKYEKLKELLHSIE